MNAGTKSDDASPRNSDTCPVSRAATNTRHAARSHDRAACTQALAPRAESRALSSRNVASARTRYIVALPRRPGGSELRVGMIGGNDRHGGPAAAPSFIIASLHTDPTACFYGKLGWQP